MRDIVNQTNERRMGGGERDCIIDRARVPLTTMLTPYRKRKGELCLINALIRLQVALIGPMAREEVFEAHFLIRHGLIACFL